MGLPEGGVVSHGLRLPPGVEVGASEQFPEHSFSYGKGEI